MQNKCDRYFNIAGYNLVIKGLIPGEEHAFPFGFAPFERENLEGHLPLFTLETGVDLSSNGLPSSYTFAFEDLDLTCEFTCSTEEFEFRMFPNPDSTSSTRLISPKLQALYSTPILLKMPRHGSYYTTNLYAGAETVSEFRFLLWMAFGVASAAFSTVAIHSSVIVYKGKAVLFLGESGTGKSTHTQLWLKHIPVCKLLNDDSPMLRIVDGEPMCFGSPWSGKTPCFVNESYPVAAIVRLQQSPVNQITRLSKIEAFTALYPSCPPSFTTDSGLTDYVCNSLSAIIGKVPVYHLNCLPDSDAARLSSSTIFVSNNTETVNCHD